MKAQFVSPRRQSPQTGIGAAAVAVVLLLGGTSKLGAQPTLYFAYQEANAYLPSEGGVAPTAGGSIGASPQPIHSGDGSLVLEQSALAAAVVAFPEGQADGYDYLLSLGYGATSRATSYKQDQNGSTVPWDLRFPGVVQLDTGELWPADEPGNFSDAVLAQAAEYFRVAVRANPFDLEAHRGLIGTSLERMVARLFAGNNAAQYASRLRLFGGTIDDEIGYWENAIGHYQTAGDIFALATAILPDAVTLETPEYADLVADALEIFARGLGYEAEAVRQWLQLSHFATYRDPLSFTYNPAPLLGALQPKLDHMQSLLFLGSHFTHVPNYLQLDFPTVNAALVHLQKQRDATIPRGMISFAGQRTATQPGEVIGEYAPEYVPFLFREDASSLPTSFENLLREATEFIAGSETADVMARETERGFDRDRAELTAALDQIFANYNNQLGDLCGWIFADDGELHPDVIGSLLPPGDREAERPFRSGESTGRIHQQHLIVNQSRIEVEAAEQDRRNIYLKAVTARTVGELIANQSENLAQMHLTDGASLAALERLRGREEARVNRAIAQVQAREMEYQGGLSIFRRVFNAAGALGGTAFSLLLFPPAGVSTTDELIGLGLGLVGGGLSIGGNMAADLAQAEGNAALLLKTSELQADLAQFNADINAQKQLIHAAEAAAVQFAQRDQTLWKTEEAWQAAMLDYERAALNVLMAEQRLFMQRAELANLYSRVAYLIQEIRKAVVLNTQTLNPLARPDYRLWMDYVNRHADDTFLRAQEWLYLAAKAAQYKVNSSANVSDIGMRIEAILRARRGTDLRAIRNELSADVNTLYLAQGTPTTAIPIPLRLRHYVVQNNSVAFDGEGEIDPILSLFEAQGTGESSLTASDAAWLEFLNNRLITDSATGSVRLEIPFSTSLHRPNVTPGPGFDPLKVRQNPLFSPTRYSDLISFTAGSTSAFGVRVNIRGRNLNLDPGQSVVARLRQEGASYLRTAKWEVNPQAFRLWNLKPVDGLVICSVNGAGAATLSTPQFHERSPANDRWVLVIDTLEGAGGNNAAIISQLRNITDIEVSFSIKAFTN